MSKATELARGAPCMVRSEVCNGNAETVVLAHVRSPDTGHMKPSDASAMLACSACHTLTEHNSTDPDLLLLEREAILRTHQWQERQGYTWKLVRK